MFISRICVGNKILNAFLHDELVSEPWLQLGNELVDSFQITDLAYDLSTKGVAEVELSVLEL